MRKTPGDHTSAIDDVGEKVNFQNIAFVIFCTSNVRRAEGEKQNLRNFLIISPME